MAREGLGWETVISVLFVETVLDLLCFGKDVAQSDQQRAGIAEAQGKTVRLAAAGVLQKENDMFLTVEHAIGESDELHGEGFEVHGISWRREKTREDVEVGTMLFFAEKNG